MSECILPSIGSPRVVAEKIPEEILVHIFLDLNSMYREDEKNRVLCELYSWTMVCAVCRHWRQAALRNPILWSSIDTCQPAYTRGLFLERSKDVTLDIFIGNGIELFEEPERIVKGATRRHLTFQMLKEFVHAIIPHWNRIWRLHIEIYPPLERLIMPLLNTRPDCLKELRVVVGRGWYTRLYYGADKDARLLTNVDVRSVDISWPLPLLSNLTSLWLKRDIPDYFTTPTLAEIRNVLRANPRLQSLTLINIGPRVPYSYPGYEVTPDDCYDSESSPVELPLLSHLQIETHGWGEWDWTFAHSRPLAVASILAQLIIPRRCCVEISCIRSCESSRVRPPLLTLEPYNGGVMFLNSIISLEIDQSRRGYWIKGMNRDNNRVLKVADEYLLSACDASESCGGGISRALPLPNLESLSLTCTQDPEGLRLIRKILEAYPTLRVLTELTNDDSVLSYHSRILKIIAEPLNGKLICPNLDRFQWVSRSWPVVAENLKALIQCLHQRSNLIGSKLPTFAIGAPPEVYGQFPSVNECPEVQEILKILSEEAFVIDWYPDVRITSVERIE
jgi:hypothetical protein